MRSSTLFETDFFFLNLTFPLKCEVCTAEYFSYTDSHCYSQSNAEICDWDLTILLLTLNEPL